MSLSFPCPMPSDGARVAEVVFEPDWLTTQSPEAGGRVVSMVTTQPRWRAQIMSTSLSRAATAEWRAWLRAQRNGVETFYAVDPSRRLPAAYNPRGFAGLDRAGGGAFDGTSAVWSVDDAGVELTIENLPAGFLLAPDDQIGFVWGVTRRALAAVEASTPADAEGVWTGAITPPLPAYVPAEATINLNAPECVMKIVPGSVDGPRVRFGNRSSVRFNALEHLVP